MQQSLNLVTYNIQHGRKPKEIIGNVVSLAEKNAAVFCLQEVRFHSEKNFIVDGLLKALGPEWKAEYLVSTQTFDLGLCTLWNTNRLKALHFEHILLPRLPKVKVHEKVYMKVLRKLKAEDYRVIMPETKAALIGTFEFGGQTVRVTNTHLDHLGGSGQRELQIKHIRQSLDFRKPVDSEILCGDLNTLGLYLFSHGRFKKVRTLLGLEFNTHLHRKPTTSFWQTLDHIFVKNLEIVKAEILKYKGSDHFPVFATIRLRALKN